MNFAKSLLQWYFLNQRSLPWRETRDPYFIWLSEVILQQTRVDQGMSYYHSFCQKFPTIFHLAQASEDEVLKTWQGLGYYSRARNLHATAKLILNDFNGAFPSKYNGLLKLKGIGPYTAAAIASFAFLEKKAVVDGNVMRVLSRVFGIDDPIDSTQGKKVLAALAQELIDEGQPDVYNQAIMDFGATWCTPKKPKCELCVFAESCSALRTNRVDVLPIKAKKTAVKEMYLFYFVFRDKKQTYIRQRMHSNIWKGLYEFPAVEGEGSISLKEALQKMEAELGQKITPKTVSEAYTHILSHRKITANFITADIPVVDLEKQIGAQKVDWKDLENFGWPRLIDRYLKA
jgi:A/G-specific adenine glycosylase